MSNSSDAYLYAAGTLLFNSLGGGGAGGAGEVGWGGGGHRLRTVWWSEDASSDIGSRGMGRKGVGKGGSNLRSDSCGQVPRTQKL